MLATDFDVQTIDYVKEDTTSMQKQGQIPPPKKKEPGGTT